MSAAHDSSPPARKRGRPAGIQLTKYLSIAMVHDLMPSYALPTIYQWTRELCSDGQPVLPPVRLGGRRLGFRPEDVEAIPQRLQMRLPRPAPSFFTKPKSLKKEVTHA